MTIPHIFLYGFLERKFGDILAQNNFSDAKQNKTHNIILCFCPQ